MIIFFLVLEAGVDGVVVTSAILQSKNPEASGKGIQTNYQQIYKKIVEGLFGQPYFFSSDRTKLTISSAMLTFANDLQALSILAGCLRQRCVVRSGPSKNVYACDFAAYRFGGFYG